MFSLRDRFFRRSTSFTLSRFRRICPFGTYPAPFRFTRITRITQKVAASALCVFLLLSVPAFSLCTRASAGEYDLSIGLAILKSAFEIKKCGVKNKSLSFAESEFDAVLPHTEHIRFLSLPDVRVGRLTLGGRDVKIGQTVTRRSLRSLLFVPLTDAVGSTSFTVCDPTRENGSYAVCTMFVTESENLPPNVSEQRFETVANIACKGFLTAIDPENDPFTVSIVSGAAHGTVRLLDSKSGAFCYTPRKDFTGRDIFRFRVTDSYGNRSRVERAVVHIYERRGDTVFSDMTDHWAHAAAVTLSDAGLLCGRLREDGSRVFEPDEPMSRGDFLAMIWIAVGAEETVEPTAVTNFADDADIPTAIKGYAAAAYRNGIVRGSVDGDGRICFRAREGMTRGEAALMTARLLVPENEIAHRVKTGLTEEQAAYAALRERDIFHGTDAGESALDRPLTRGQGAQVFRNVKLKAESGK